MIEYKTEGFTELEAMLRALPQNVENRVLQNATIGAMRSIRKDMQAAAPVSERQSIASQTYGRLKFNIGAERKRKRRRGSRGAAITTGDAFWAYFLEKGTRYMPAQPFFRRAFESLIPKVLDDLRIRLQKGIEKEMKKL